VQTIVAVIIVELVCGKRTLALIPIAFPFLIFSLATGINKLVSYICEPRLGQVPFAALSRPFSLVFFESFTDIPALIRQYSTEMVR
jgi:hypothetical protein